MYSQAELSNILFLDCETAPIAGAYEDLSERMQKLWDKKSLRYKNQEPEKSSAELFMDKAGIHAEFAKIVCISAGYLRFDDQNIPHMTMKSYSGPDEAALLKEFGVMLDKYTAVKEARHLCAHNGKEFDFPFLGRRFVINQLSIPLALRVQGRKPWETQFIDTMELWKFGDYKAYTSLDLLAAILDVPSPKDDMDGSQVASVFWNDKNYDRIQHYCEKDVITTAQVLLRMSRMPLIPNTEESW
ncbi:MAG: ribonuclease H-like domain-containing protein [Bacteroidia bacterium]|nr:ribonuclease H-like domain-containing protein [Bacteroidia bacterium]